MRRYMINVIRRVPAFYQQIGAVYFEAPKDDEAALKYGESGLDSGELVPEWVPPEEETPGVELAPGEPGPTIIDIRQAFDLDEQF